MKKNTNSNPVVHEQLYPFKVDIFTSGSSWQDDTEETYASWSSETDFTVNGVFTADYKTSDQQSMVDVGSAINLKDNQKAYLLLFSSDSGDSFGMATNDTIECVHLFKNLQLAQVAQRRIYLDYHLQTERNQEYQNYRLKASKNASFQRLSLMSDCFKYFFVNFNSYIDYFGGLNELNLYEVELNKRCTTVAKIADLAAQEISFKAFLETEAFYESFSQKQQLESAVPSIHKSRKPRPTFKV